MAKPYGSILETIGNTLLTISISHAVLPSSVPVALGTQTQGSTLRPAGFCGAFGFKPTHGALTMQGVHPI